MPVFSVSLRCLFLALPLDRPLSLSFFSFDRFAQLNKLLLLFANGEVYLLNFFGLASLQRYSSSINLYLFDCVGLFDFVRGILVLYL